jgi:uncharacterized protein (TIGR00255 family)
MTGYGSARGEVSGLEASVEIHSVNHRHLQVRCHLPEPLAAWEVPIEQELRRLVGRGSIRLRIGIAAASGDGSPFDEGCLSGYVRRLRRLGGRLGISEGPSWRDLLVLPGVIRSVSVSAPLRPDLLMPLLRQAVRRLQKSRRREGARTHRDLARAVAEVGRLLGKVERLYPRQLEEARGRFRRRVEEALGPGVRAADGELLKEAVLATGRADVAEECSRLRGHLDHFRELLRRGRGVGRRLEFLSQEMLREANTMGSKMVEAGLLHTVVLMKDWIERIREQAANVE